MKKQKRTQEVTTKPEELVEYKLSDYVNKTFIWKILVTLPSCDSLEKINKVLFEKNYKDKKLNMDLKNIHKEFFEILHLLYYYVSIGKDESILVKYTLYTPVSLLTEAISKLAINRANHADRPLQAYRKMLKLEKLIQEFNCSIVLQDDDEDDFNIKLAIQAVSEYIGLQFIVIDRVLSAIYLQYLDHTKTIEKDPGSITADSPFTAIYGILTTFFEEMRKLMQSYTEHDFSQLLITAGEATLDKNVLLMTPERMKSFRSAAGDKAIQHGVAPDSTPTGISDDVRSAAQVIKKSLEYDAQHRDKKIIFKKTKTIKKTKEEMLEDIADMALFSRLQIQDPSADKASSATSLRSSKPRRRKLLEDITNIQDVD